MRARRRGNVESVAHSIRPHMFRLRQHPRFRRLMKNSRFLRVRRMSAPSVSPRIPARSKNREELLRVLCSSRIDIFWAGAHADGWGNGIRTDFCTDWRLKLKLQGAGARPRLSGRRNGFVCGTLCRLSAADRFAIKQIFFGVQWRLNTLLSASGYLAYRLFLFLSSRPFWLGR